MKRFILSILLASLVAVLIGVTAHYNGPGYVVFSFIDYTGMEAKDIAQEAINQAQDMGCKNKA